MEDVEVCEQLREMDAMRLIVYCCVKYVEPTKVPVYNTDDNDIILMRYAEVLLIYAESMFEQGKLTQPIVDETINQLRKRVGMHEMNLVELEQALMIMKQEQKQVQEKKTFIQKVSILVMSLLIIHILNSLKKKPKLKVKVKARNQELNLHLLFLNIPLLKELI